MLQVNRITILSQVLAIDDQREDRDLVILHLSVDDTTIICECWGRLAALTMSVFPGDEIAVTGRLAYRRTGHVIVASSFSTEEVNDDMIILIDDSVS